MSLRLAEQNPTLMTGFLTYQHLGQRSLEYGYLGRCADLSTNPMEFMMNEALSHRKIAKNDDARIKLLMEDTINCAVNDEYEEKPYDFGEEDEEEEDKQDEEDRVEYTYRHPSSDGNNKDDDEDDDDEDSKWAPVHTKVAKLLWAIDMVSPEQQQQQICSFRPAVQFQISIRVDEKNQCFYYDCFEYVPSFVDRDNSLPTRRDVNRFHKTIDMEPTRQHSYFSDDDDDDSDDEDDEDDELDQPVQLRVNNEANRSVVHMQAISGKFFNSRLFRIKIPFQSIQGMLLRVTKKRESSLEDQTGVLILELSQPTNNDFAVRSVASKYSQCNQFCRIEDWTSNKIASKATRHYIYASILELQSLVTHLCHLDERLNDMMMPPQQQPSPHSPAKKKPKKKKTTKGTNEKIVWGPSNSLGNSDVAYSKAPPPNVDEEDKKAEARRSSTLTPDQVDKLFQKTFGTSDANECLKAAVLRGHYRLDDESNVITRDTVLYTGDCYGCNNTLTMMWGDALDQPTYAGLDYEDGGRKASVRCEDCGGNYLTSLCDGNAHFDSGKFHNHCTECPNFGVCIRDYRTAHCEHCGEHYFCGLSGFECQACGGGKAQKYLNEMTKSMPSSSTWNGEACGKELAQEVLADNDKYGPVLMQMAMLMRLGQLG